MTGVERYVNAGVEVGLSLKQGCLWPLSLFHSSWLFRLVCYFSCLVSTYMKFKAVGMVWEKVYEEWSSVVQE